MGARAWPRRAASGAGVNPPQPCDRKPVAPLSLASVQVALLLRGRNPPGMRALAAKTQALGSCSKTRLEARLQAQSSSPNCLHAASGKVGGDTAERRGAAGRRWRRRPPPRAVACAPLLLSCNLLTHCPCPCCTAPVQSARRRRARRAAALPPATALSWEAAKDVAGLVAFSALPFAAVQALADSQAGKDLLARLEAEKPALQRAAREAERERTAVRQQRCASIHPSIHPPIHSWGVALPLPRVVLCSTLFDPTVSARAMDRCGTSSSAAVLPCCAARGMERHGRSGLGHGAPSRRHTSGAQRSSEAAAGVAGSAKRKTTACASPPCLPPPSPTPSHARSAPQRRAAGRLRLRPTAAGARACKAGPIRGAGAAARTLGHAGRAGGAGARSGRRGES